MRQRNGKKRPRSGVYTRLTGTLAALALEQPISVVEIRPMLARLLVAIAAQRAIAERTRARRSA